jgi:hypothetical protein
MIRLQFYKSSRYKRAKEGFLMANTFSQIYIQIVFAVSGRSN